jgi:DNA-directed RNA polymerase alpha subunit
VPTLGLLVQRTETELLKTRGVDREALEQIKDALADRSLELGRRPDDLGAT